MNVNDCKGLPEHILYNFACDCVERALMRERAAGREPDPRSWEAVRIKRRWVEGRATDQELGAARDAAEAAWEAAWAAAWAAAAWAAEAAWDAAWDAAVAWTWGAVRAEAGAAAGAAAREAEESWQRAHLASLLDQYQQERISLVQALMGRALQLQAQRAPVQLWQQETDEGLF